MQKKYTEWTTTEKLLSKSSEQTGNTQKLSNLPAVKFVVHFTTKQHGGNTRTNSHLSNYCERNSLHIWTSFSYSFSALRSMSHLISSSLMTLHLKCTFNSLLSRTGWLLWVFRSLLPDEPSCWKLTFNAHLCWESVATTSVDSLPISGYCFMAS